MNTGKQQGIIYATVQTVSTFSKIKRSSVLRMSWLACCMAAAGHRGRREIARGWADGLMVGARISLAIARRAFSCLSLYVSSK